MFKPSVGSIQRTARISSLVLGIVPILVFLGFTIELLIAKYYLRSPHGLTWFDVRIAIGALFTGLYIGGPLLIARFVAERKALVGAIMMLTIAIPFILFPIMAWEIDDWAAALGLIYIVPAVLYLVSWRRGRLQHVQTSSSRTGQSAT